MALADQLREGDDGAIERAGRTLHAAADVLADPVTPFVYRLVAYGAVIDAARELAAGRRGESREPERLPG